MSESTRVPESDVELDVRMSNETKEFVREWQAKTKSFDMTTMDAETTRRMRTKIAQAQAGSYSFDQVEVTDLSVPNAACDGVNVPVKSFRHRETEANAPIVVFFHGGGWTIGSSFVYFHTCASLAQATKCVWLSVDYRLAPEHQLDAQLSDCRSVVDYVLRNKQQFSSADAKIGVCGDSAGGNWAAVMAHEFKEQLDFQILVYPAVDLDLDKYESKKEFASHEFLMTTELLKYFAHNLLGDITESAIRSPRVSPLYRDDFSKLPRCLMLTAELDPLADASVAYHQKIVANDSPSQLHVVNGTIHSFFDQGLSFPIAFAEALDVIQRFIRSF